MIATRQATVDEFASLSLEGPWELVDGEMVQLNPTGGESGSISAVIAAELLIHVRAQDLGWVFGADTGFVLFPGRDTVRSPDAAVVLRNRLDQRPRGFVPLAPDLAVEVLSPSDQMSEALGKIGMYIDAGVRLVWLVDPKTQTITVYRPDAAPLSLHAGDSLDGDDVLPGFLFPVAGLFE